MSPCEEPCTVAAVVSSNRGRLQSRCPPFRVDQLDAFRVLDSDRVVVRDIRHALIVRLAVARDAAFYLP